jgi:hypothetical protein
MCQKIQHRWVDDIKMDHKETVLESVDWIHLAQDRSKWLALVNTIMWEIF